MQLNRHFGTVHTDPYTYGYKYYIIARLKEQDQTYWTLKWQKS
jgi:hypothetical protein